jgi:DNA-binding CsgD family transcriptional regulator
VPVACLTPTRHLHQTLADKPTSLLDPRLLDALAAFPGIRGVASVQPVRHGEGAAFIRFRGSSVEPRQLLGLAEWAARPDAHLVERLLHQAAQGTGPVALGASIREAGTILADAGLPGAVALAVPSHGRPSRLEGWLIVSPDGPGAPVIDLLAAAARLAPELRPLPRLLPPPPSPFTALYDQDGALMQASQPGLPALHEVSALLPAPGIPLRSPLVSPLDGVLTATRLDALPFSYPKWVVQLHPSVPAEVGPQHRLTPRQLQVAELAARGLNSAQIAENLRTSPATVKVHLRSAYLTLEVASRAELGSLADALSLLQEAIGASDIGGEG